MDDYQMLMATIVFASFIILFMLFIGYENVKKRVNKAQTALNKRQAQMKESLRRTMRPIQPDQ
jgi:Na+/melibiose symporter-like transporter